MPVQVPISLLKVATPKKKDFFLFYVFWGVEQEYEISFWRSLLVFEL